MKKKRTVSKAHVCWNKKSVGHLERAPCTWAPKPWCPNTLVPQLCWCFSLNKSSCSDKTRKYWEHRNSLETRKNCAPFWPIAKKGRLEMAPELKNLTYKSGARGAVRKTVASSFRPLLHKISNQESSTESEKEDKEDERRSFSADSFDESDFSTQNLRGVYPRIQLANLQFCHILWNLKYKWVKWVSNQRFLRGLSCKPILDQVSLSS